ncbi:MAG: RodZ domain-containing protein [Solirubrobacteraceae bacterium]
MTASRGACWVLARAGGEQGRVLYDAVVEQGSSVEVQARRLWVRFGAAGYVDLELNGRPLRMGRTGTVDILLTAAGVQS